jgi:hypothetical protein
MHMARRFAIRTLLAAVPGVLAAAGAGLAQQPGGSASAYQAQQSLSASAYQAATVVPGMPFLNPYMMSMGQANPDYMTYMYLQNQRSGGIGSGVISGTRVAPGIPAGSVAPPRGERSIRDASAPPTGSFVMPRGEPSAPGSRGAYPARPPVGLNRTTLPMAASDPAGNAGASFMRGPRTNPDAGRYFNRTTPARNNGR